jgi:hypothetical protein
MEALKEIFMIGLVLAVVFAIAHILVGLYWRWQNRKDTKISEAYRKAVEKHQLSESKEYAMPMGEAVLNDNSSEEYRIKNNKATRAKVIDRASRSTGDFLSVPASLVDSNRNLWDSEPIRDTETERLLDSLSTDYSGAGHGGSFGGGGASGSLGAQRIAVTQIVAQTQEDLTAPSSD